MRGEHSDDDERPIDVAVGKADQGARILEDQREEEVGGLVATGETYPGAVVLLLQLEIILLFQQELS